MSRSYRKISLGKRWPYGGSYYLDVDTELGIPDWGKTRMKELSSIHAEMKSLDYGDILFPLYHGLDRCSWFSIPRTSPLYLKYTREWYFKEIKNILNDYYVGYRDWKRIFLDDFFRIKGLTLDSHCKSIFYWLNTKKARRVIKGWKDDPLSVLKYLTDTGLIEQAVRREYKLIISK